MVWPLSRSAPQTLSSWPFPDNPFHHSRFYTESKADLAARVSTDFQVTSESFFGLRGGKWGELFIRRESSVLTHALPYLLTSGCLHYLSLQRQKYKPAVWWNCAHSSVNPPPHTHTHTHTHTNHTDKLQVEALNLGELRHQLVCQAVLGVDGSAGAKCCSPPGVWVCSGYTVMEARRRGGWGTVAGIVVRVWNKRPWWLKSCKRQEKEVLKVIQWRNEQTWSSGAPSLLS